MPVWFIRGLRRGVVTTRYPAHPDPTAALLPTPPKFHANLLTRARADRLVAVCPSRALRRDGDLLVFDLGACTSCGRCQDADPEIAAPGGEFELAVTDRSHLIERLRISP